MPSPPDDYDRRSHRRSSAEDRDYRSSRYNDDADNEDYAPPKRSSRRDARPKYYDDDIESHGPPPSKVPDAPSATRSDPRDIEPNMKASRRDKYAADDASGIDGSRKDDRRDLPRRTKPSKRYPEDEDDRYDHRSAKPRAYPDDDDGSYRTAAPRRSNTVRESGRRDHGDRRRGEEDRYNSSYDDLPRQPRRAPTRDYDDRDRGYKSDGRDVRRRSDRYDDAPDDYDRGYRSGGGGGGGRRQDPYDDRDRDRNRRSDRDRDRDRDRGYRSDDHGHSRRGYESDRGGYRSDRDRDRYYDSRDRRDRYRDSRDGRYDDRDRDRDRDRPKKKGGLNFDPSKLSKYIEEGQKHYHVVEPILKTVMSKYIGGGGK